MSEFQYYEFYSIDKELTKRERNEVDKLSSRFSPTSRSVVYTYSYSDFKHDEKKVLLKYFDFFMYWSNWGIKRIMYKIPEELVNFQDILQYNCSVDGEYTDTGIQVYKKAKFVIIDIKFSDEEGGYWIEEDNRWSSDLMGIRQDLLNGDYRSLFIMWLHAKKMEFELEEIDETLEISRQLIPPNLKSLNSNLNCLIDFFEVDIDWVCGASKYSENSSAKGKNYLEIVEKLTLEKKDEYIMRLLKGESNLNLKLKKEIDNSIEISTKSSVDKITLKQLLTSIKEQEGKRIRLKNEKLEKKRLQKIKEIEKNRNTILKEIDYHILKGTGKSYDEAIHRILDLRELAIHQKKENEFMKWIAELKKELSPKRVMLKRIEKEGM